MNRHPTDLISLVFGLAFVALAAASVSTDPVALVEARWLWPSALVVLGLALLLAPLSPDRSDAAAPGGSDQAAPTTPDDGVDDG